MSSSYPRLTVCFYTAFMETLTREREVRVKKISAELFSRDVRSLLAGHFGQSVFSFAVSLAKAPVTDKMADACAFLMYDALQLYDFLMITSLQPQTVRLGVAEDVIKKGGRFINLQFHFRDHGSTRLELALSEETRRRKIQASLLKRMQWRSGRMSDFPTIAISATSWSRSPVLTEMITGNMLAGERFFPVQPEERMDNKQFDNYFSELEAFQEYATLMRAQNQS